MIEWLSEHAFAQMAALLMMAAAAGGVALVLRQPLIVAFIGVGVAAGPAGIGLIQPEGRIDLLAEVGIALLLFVVGLKLDPFMIRTLGPVALATGLGQVVFTSVIGFGIALALGLGAVESVYVAVALTFSSTIIIVKLLTDKREIDSLHGRIAVGFLIVQDIVVVLALITISAMAPLTAETGGAAGPAAAAGGDDGGGSLAVAVGSIALRGIVLLAGVALLMKFVLPRLLHRLARSGELLVLFSVAWAVALAAGCEIAGFSREVGAFLAGVSIAATPYRDAIAGRLTSLRDFLLLFFFVKLGAQLDLGQIGEQIVSAAIFSAFVLIGNPLIVMAIMGLMGYRRRTGFLAGLTVAQISEFSLVLVAMGAALGHVTGATMGMVTLVGLITIGVSTYMIQFSHPLFARLSPALSIFERREPTRESEGESSGPETCDIIVLGLGRYGGSIARRLRDDGYSVLGVDFDPTALAHWRAGGGRAEYGDAEDPELAARLPLAGAKWVVSSIPDMAASMALLAALSEAGYRGGRVVTAHRELDEHRLKEAGATLVLAPFRDAAGEAADLIDAATPPNAG